MTHPLYLPFSGQGPSQLRPFHPGPFLSVVSGALAHLHAFDAGVAASLLSQPMHGPQKSGNRAQAPAPSALLALQGFRLTKSLSVSSEWGGSFLTAQQEVGELAAHPRDDWLHPS